MRPEDYEDKIAFLHAFDDAADAASHDALHTYAAGMALAIQRQVEADIMKAVSIPAVMFEPVESTPTRKRFKTIG